ncbi:unnamed protein product [Cylicocyclus nassatus]|uniref:RBR-type E3 ubiquitin transferase n=1 Tax=Cylicocyclus nassatus TaxID=53992 RepID=A0AA36MC06_CYLNA|nr:unnamed protein product [Cylicocyclus nassatus]
MWQGQDIRRRPLSAETEVKMMEEAQFRVGRRYRNHPVCTNLGDLFQSIFLSLPPTPMPRLWETALYQRGFSKTAGMNAWFFSPDTRKVWDNNGSLIDEPIPLWETAEDETMSAVSRPVVKVETEMSRLAAERVCSVMSKQGSLENLNLDDTKPVEVDADRSYRMWYPEEMPKRKSSSEALFHCKPNIQAAKDVKWDKLLPHQGAVDEVKMRDQRLRTDLAIGPKSRHRLLDHISKNCRQNMNKSYTVDDLDPFARADISNAESDILRQCSVSVYYPDVNYAAESSRLREALLKKIGEKRSAVKREKLEIALPGSSNAIAVSDGGTCELLRNGKSMSLIVDVPKDEDLEQYCRFFCKNALRACRLKKSERRVLSNHFLSNRMEKFKNPALIQFATVEDSKEALETHSSHGRKVAQYLPRTFIAGCDRWNNINNATMTFRVKWYKRPSSGVGVVKFNSASDAQLASDVFIYHGYSEAERHSCFGDDTKAIKYIPNSYQHDSLFEHHMREILEPNDIHIVRAYLQRIPRSRNDLSVKVQQQISRAIIEYLIRRRVWDGHIPWLQQEWRALLSSNDLPWRWNALDIKDNEGIATPCEAELILDNVEQGLDLVDFLTASTADFTKLYDERTNACQKLFIKPIYCITVPVTREVRVACDTFIRQLNEEETAAAHATNDEMQCLKIVDLTWNKGHNNCDDVDTSIGELSVQGWPVRRVQEVATRLISLFEGTYMDCSDEVYGRLLYGHGAKYVDFAREKLRGKAVIDVDLLRERITVVGESADLAKEKLKFFAENSHAFKLSEVITLGPPRYLFYMRDVLCFGVGIERLREICGGADLEFVDNVGIQFSGTLEQYELLTNYLEEVDERLVMSSSPTNASSKPTCPVCLSPVSNAFYSLECGHYYCLKCIIFQVRTMIRNRHLPIRCVYDDCEKPIAVSDLKELILGEERLPWLSGEKLRPLIDSSLDCIIRKHPSLTRCPTPDCFGVCDVSGKSGVFQCESCKKERCTGCMLEPHENLTCEEYSRLRTDGVASLKAYLSKNEGKARECPTKGCGAIIEKGEGCYHMQCTMCKIHFCWLCDYTSDQQSKIYGHLRENHGAIGAEWPRPRTYRTTWTSRKIGVSFLHFGGVRPCSS